MRTLRPEGSLLLRVAAVATAIATASVSSAIEIVNNVPLQFGTLVTSAGGSVDVLPDGTRRTVGVYVVAGTVSAAAFTVTGARGNPHYSITLPASATLTGPGGATMRVDRFQSSPNRVGMTKPPGYVDRLSVGATLHLNAGQRPGRYSGVFPVTVNLGN